MKIEQIFKRYMKEAGIYGSNKSKMAIEFVSDYEEIFTPFNSFRWENTDEGHNYWYSKAIGWVLYIYDNLENIDEEDKTKYGISINTIKDNLYELLNFYCLEKDGHDSLIKIDGYKNAEELHAKLLSVKAN